jgi:hypothetical protein
MFPRMARLINSPLAVLLLSAALGANATGCAGEGEADDEAGDVGDPDDCAEPPCLAAPDSGLQLRTIGKTIEPGQDIEYCEIVALPGTADDTYYVNRMESEMLPGSHHLIVSAVAPGSESDLALEHGDIVECTGGGQFGLDLLPVLGQQLPRYEESFPDGVGRIYHGGQKLIFDYHYFNATDGALPARAAINLHTTDASHVQHVSGVFGVFDVTFSVPAGETREFPNSCTFNHDVLITKLTRHTHQWGRDFPVSFNDGTGEPELIFVSPNYEDPDFVYDEPFLIEAGQGFEFTCTFENGTDPGRELKWGLKATDEMCILWIVAHSPTELELPADTACR